MTRLPGTTGSRLLSAPLLASPFRSPSCSRPRCSNTNRPCSPSSGPGPVTSASFRRPPHPPPGPPWVGGRSSEKCPELAAGSSLGGNTAFFTFNLEKYGSQKACF